MVVGQAEFLLGQHHAGRLDAAQLGRFDGQPATVVLVAVDDPRPDDGEGNPLAPVAHLQVGRTRHHALMLRRAIVDCRQHEAVGVGMRVNADNLADENLVALPLGADALHLRHFEAGHRQPMGQLVQRQGNVYILLEPGERN